MPDVAPAALWRPVVVQVAHRFLACGGLEYGVARIRRDDCAHEYLLALSCTCRSCCPSCPARRLAIWTPWLDTTLRAPVSPPAPSQPSRAAAVRAAPGHRPGDRAVLLEGDSVRGS
jgi:hypothetical protein